MDTPNNINTKLLEKLAKEQLESATNASNLSNKVDDLQDTVNSLKDGMIRILSIIDNDEKTDTPGIVKQQRIAINRIEKVEQKMDSYDAKIGIAFTIFTIIGATISTLVGLFYKK